MRRPGPEGVVPRDRQQPARAPPLELGRLRVALAAALLLPEADDRDGQRLLLRRRLHPADRLRLRLAAEEATFGLSEVNWGSFPAGLVSRVLRRDDAQPRRAVLHHDRRHLRRPPRRRDRPGQRRLPARPAPRRDGRRSPRSCMSKNPHTLRMCKEVYKHVKDMDYEDAEDYIWAKLDTLDRPRPGRARARDQAVRRGEELQARACRRTNTRPERRRGPARRARPPSTSPAWRASSPGASWPTSGCGCIKVEPPGGDAVRGVGPVRRTTSQAASAASASPS